MSGRRDDSLVLDDLLQAATRLVAVAGSLPTGTLGGNPDIDEVVLWNLTLLGEASKRLSPTTRARFPDLPWSEFARTRDFVIHHYEGIQWPLVEQICTRDLPGLLPRLRDVRDQLRREIDAR
jgi:uncharacterized protein with HEPN domain